MSDLVKGVGVPNYTPNNTVAGSNASSATALPGISYGDIDPYAMQRNGERMPGFVPKQIRRINLALDNARNRERLKIAGTFIWCVDGSDPGAIVDIQIATQENDPIPFRPGIQISGVPFGELFLSNTAQAGQSLVLIITGDFPHDRVDVE